LFTEPTPLKAFQSLNVPVLYMVGKHSTPSALGVARLLMTALRRVEIVEFENLGHMGPVTHPDTVNEVIEQFLERHNFEVADRGGPGCLDRISGLISVELRVDG
jgi:pimeloyl-ACP methyl ester carboxylesterase